MTNELDPESLRKLLDATAALTRSVEPEHDAWPAIRDRIDAQRVTPIVSGAVDRAGSARRWSEWKTNWLRSCQREQPARSRRRPRPRCAMLACGTSNSCGNSPSSIG